MFFNYILLCGSARKKYFPLTNVYYKIKLVHIICNISLIIRFQNRQYIIWSVKNFISLNGNSGSIDRESTDANQIIWYFQIKYITEKCFNPMEWEPVCCVVWRELWRKWAVAIMVSCCQNLILRMSYLRPGLKRFWTRWPQV